MRNVSPIGSATLMLLGLALIAQIKSGAYHHDAYSGFYAFGKSKEEANALLASLLRAGQVWANVRTVLLGLGLVMGLFWLRQRARQRLLNLNRPPQPPQFSAQRSIQRFRRRSR
jgi:hypothetical protein